MKSLKSLKNDCAKIMQKLLAGEITKAEARKQNNAVGKAIKEHVKRLENEKANKAVG